jgi:Flp pilus assembly protein CpaB
MSSGNRSFPKIGGGNNRRGSILQSRRGSVLASAISAIIAGALIYGFVSSSNNSSPPPATAVVSQATVWVATNSIPAGTPYDAVVDGGMLKRETIPAANAVAGAIDDPSVLAGQVVAASIASGQELTTADFSTTAKVNVDSYLTGTYRADAFALDAAHGLTSYLNSGEHVDVMGQKGSVSLMLAENIEVLGNANGDVVLRLTDKQALALAAATGKYALWLSLRPAHGAKQSIKIGAQETF